MGALPERPGAGGGGRDPGRGVLRRDLRVRLQRRVPPQAAQAEGAGRLRERRTVPRAFRDWGASGRREAARDVLQATEDRRYLRRGDGEVLPGEIRLSDARTLPFRYAMVVPPFVGAEVVNASGLGNAKGFIEVKDTYQTLSYPNVYAVGIATAVN